MPGPNRDFPGILPAGRSSARGHKKGASAACIVANPHHSPTTPSLHVVAACRIASQNTDDRPRAWLASAHHDASPDTLSSQHEPCGGRGASPTRRRPTSIAALSTVTAARRQTAARCAFAGHLRLVAQTCAAMLMRSRRQASPQGRHRCHGVEVERRQAAPKVGKSPNGPFPKTTRTPRHWSRPPFCCQDLDQRRRNMDDTDTGRSRTSQDEAGQAKTKTVNSSGAKMRKEESVVRLFLLDSGLSFLGGMSFRIDTIDFHRGEGERNYTRLQHSLFIPPPPSRANKHTESMTTPPPNPPLPQVTEHGNLPKTSAPLGR